MYNKMITVDEFSYFLLLLLMPSERDDLAIYSEAQTVPIKKCQSQWG